MKKIFAMILAAAMLFAVTACSAKPEEKETVRNDDSILERAELNYTATVIQATEENGLPFDIELPTEILGDIATVLSSNGTNGSFEMTTGCKVVVQKSDKEDSSPFVSSTLTGFTVMWVRNKVTYIVSDLSAELEPSLCEWLDERFAE